MKKRFLLDTIIFWVEEMGKGFIMPIVSFSFGAGEVPHDRLL